MNKEIILILDNEHYIQWTLKALLETEKCFPITADTVEMALDHFSTHAISGLITEYRIGAVCTVDAIRDLKKRFPGIYVMILTNGEVKAREYEEIINAGVDDFFTKPFSSEKILLHLKKGLKQREVFIQKDRLEQELDRVKRKWHLPFVGVAKERRLVR
jgi:DNA-binding NtrC family response regulator